MKLLKNYFLENYNFEIKEYEKIKFKALPYQN